MLDVGFLYCLCQSAFLSQLILYCIYDVKKIEQSVHVSLSMNKIKVTVDLTTPHWHLKMDICGEMLFSTCKSSSWKFNINMLEIKNHHFRWLFLILSLVDDFPPPLLLLSSVAISENGNSAEEKSRRVPNVLREQFFHLFDHFLGIQITSCFAESSKDNSYMASYHFCACF